MALVKKSKMAPSSDARTPSPSNVDQAPKLPRTTARNAKPVSAARETVSERVAAATEELASGLTEAAAAAAQLRRSMDQIASGADEAAGASQEQSQAIKRIFGSLTAARNEAEGSRRRTEVVQRMLADTAAQITASARAIERNAARQSSSLNTISELERHAKDVGSLTKAVSRISDQTNLLSLNAAIEAARAGEHGRGFAVVADEVRALAETSDKSARDVDEHIVAIQTDVRTVVSAVRAASEAAANESKAAVAMVEALEARHADIDRLAEVSQEILTSALEAERAAAEALKGAELVAVAAEQQSSAAGEAQTAVQQQTTSLDQGQIAAAALAKLAGGLRRNRANVSSAEEIGSTAEELSAAIQELSSAATQINAAVDQINRGSQQQAAATHETSRALEQIERSAKLAQERSNGANERLKALEAATKETRFAVERLIESVATALKGTQASGKTMARLDLVGRRVEKTVDSIALTAVQTNMLAVSGSVEAARAGEAGRGFAVVSADIRSLAREASENSERARETVRSVLDQIGALRRDMETVIAASETELETSRSVFVSLDKVDRELAALGVANGVVLAGAGDILSAAVDLAAGARQIAAGAEQTSNAARLAATAAAEQARGADDLAAAIEEIASLADELKLQNA